MAPMILFNAVSALLSKKNVGERHTDPFGMDKDFTSAIRPIFEFLYYAYFRVDAVGLENIPTRGPILLVANHSGGLPYDAVMINLAIYNNNPRQHVRFLVEDFVFTLPGISTFIRKTGGVRACHENATALLKSQWPTLVFPEGIKGIEKTYDERYKLKKFGKGGFVRLAINTKATVVPVSVIGAEEIHPIIWKSRQIAKPFGIPYVPLTTTFPWLGPLGLIPLPSKVRIIFGRPLSFKKFKRSDINNDKIINAETKKIRRQIQTTINTELKKRTSIWY